MHFEENVVLAPFTTLRIGGPARFYARVTSRPELLEAVGFARKESLPLFVLGGGSNLVVPDEGFPGLVLHVALTGEMVPQREDGSEDVFYTVPAGNDWDALVKTVCDVGLSGMECLAGIPGTVGGSPIQNIGAYGQEVSDTISSVEVFDLEGNAFRRLRKEECGFAYRRSIFNTSDRGRFLVTEVVFRFDPTLNVNLGYPDLKRYFADKVKPNPTEVEAAVRSIRARKGMYLEPGNEAADLRSAGSFFKNPVVRKGTFDQVVEKSGVDADMIPCWPVGPDSIKFAAAWLIEHAGFPKGFAPSLDSSVAISSLHTLALVNRSGRATCGELLALRDRIVGGVESRFGIRLEQEPVFLR